MTSFVRTFKDWSLVTGTNAYSQRLSYTVMAALFIALSGCTVQPTEGGGYVLQTASLSSLINQPGSGTSGEFHSASAPSNNSYPLSEDQQLVDETAERLGNDQKTGGMLGVINDIQSCYTRSMNAETLRSCVALDMASKWVDDAMEAKMHMANLPYFKTEDWVARMNRYASRAFGSKAAALDFMKNDSVIARKSLSYST